MITNPILDLILAIVFGICAGLLASVIFVRQNKPVVKKKRGRRKKDEKKQND